MECRSAHKCFAVPANSVYKRFAVPANSVYKRSGQNDAGIGLLETYPAATAARRAPNVLIVLIDDAGPDLPTTLMRARGFRPRMAAIYERTR
jgi:hypothetical protein